MQKTEKGLIVLILILYSFYGFSQRKEIKSNDDYTVLNIAIEKYFVIKKFSNSLFYNSEVTKKHIESKEIKRAIIRRKKRDTLYIKLYILIVYNSEGTNILNIYENLDSNWKLKFSLSNNYFVNKIRF